MGNERTIARNPGLSPPYHAAMITGQRNVMVDGAWGTSCVESELDRQGQKHAKDRDRYG